MRFCSPLLKAGTRYFYLWFQVFSCLCLPFRAYKNNTLKHNSVYEITLPLVSPVLLFLLCTTWIFMSPMDILEVHPRLFYFMVGTAFANISVSGFCFMLQFIPGGCEACQDAREVGRKRPAQM